MTDDSTQADGRHRMAGRRGALTWAVGLAALTAGLLWVFARWPELDLAATAAFFTPGQGFAWARVPQLVEMRQDIWDIALVPLAVALVAGLAGLVLRRGRVMGVATRLWGFVVLLYLLGPGLLVNALLKAHWGRARPETVAEFGGSARFTPPHLPADQCLSNCSFVSGEAAAVAALAISVHLVLRDALPDERAVRRIIDLCLAFLVVAGAGLRVAFGRHFLSDVTLAAVLTALVAAILWAILRPAGQGGHGGARRR
ncbi:phosphatase PAP2 family protein [Phaeovulum vinaykumarii]|uniref:PAP2 superfamily protein n=1 Tax=Phaeovulum vinaykumarii TaxID=407234 RepID=A0A1N7KX90_9RHOB|nr:phosphatase PAP2 family protein [Phaeovulum vinaykumarii]SIS66030.1 PAP2 superfamily protein [Phaeovulum vinaykumarii]SOC01148.1 PAP2 superfamily protein [Phaeovulum vinaykumarii]